MFSRVSLIACVGWALVAGSAAVPGAAAQPVPVGITGPFTGPNAPFGIQMRQGAEQAVADINAYGGVLGHPLAMTAQDDACEPRQAVSVANGFANDGAVLVVGHFCSSSSIAASQVYTEEGILQITPASTNPAFTDQGAWNRFRTCGRDDQQGKAAGHYIATQHKDAKVAVLNDNSAYGKGLADETEHAMRAAGKDPAMVSAYVPGERDYTALVSRMKEAGIDLIYIGGYPTETGLIARQAKEQGLHATLMGGDALVTSEYWQISGPAGEGTEMTFPADPRKLPEAAATVASFQAKHIDPEGYVLYTYAAFQIWAEAAAKAGSTDPHKVAAMLKSGGPWDSVIGKIAFNDKGDVQQAHYVLYKWHNGTYGEE